MKKLSVLKIPFHDSRAFIRGKKCLLSVKMVRPYTPPQVCSVARLHLLSGCVVGFLLLIFFSLVSVMNKIGIDMKYRYLKSSPGRLKLKKT